MSWKSKVNILVVDDTPANLSLLTQMLSREGYRVRVAPSGKLALASIHATLPDLVLLDVNIPDIDGYEVCTRIKSNERTYAIPIIFISALDTTIDKVKAFTLGGIDYITKPFEPIEVLARIENQLRLREAQLQLQAQNAQLQLLLTTTQSINEAVDVNDALDVVLDKICQTLGLDFAEAWILSPDGTSFERSSIWSRNPIPAPNFSYLYDFYGAHPHCKLPKIVWLSNHAVLMDMIHLQDLSHLRCQIAGEYGLCAGFGVPILFDEHIVGALLFFHEQQVPIDQRSLDLIDAVATQLGAMIQRKRAEAALKRANQELERLATLDGLTHVANRRRFDEYLLQEWRRLARDQQPLALILFDVDYFKNFNDHYGHQFGDDCLQQVANAASEMVKRPADLLARYGGEEFAVILPNTDTEGAVTVARAIQAAIHALNLPHPQSNISDRLTISLGVASVLPMADLSPEALINAADRALYAAKQQGRDRLVVRGR